LHWVKKNVFNLNQELKKARCKYLYSAEFQPIKALLLTGIIKITAICNNWLHRSPDFIDGVIFIADMTYNQLLNTLLINHRKQCCCLLII